MKRDSFVIDSPANGGPRKRPAHRECNRRGGSALEVLEPIPKVVESKESVVIHCLAPEWYEGVLDVEARTSPCR